MVADTIMKRNIYNMNTRRRKDTVDNNILNIIKSSVSCFEERKIRKIYAMKRKRIEWTFKRNTGS